MAHSENNHKIDNCPFYVPKENAFFHQMRKSYYGNQTSPFKAEALGHQSGYRLGVPGSINSYQQEFYMPNKKR